MKVTFDSKNKSKNAGDFPRFSMDYQEKARIALAEPEPEFAWTHTLKGLRISNGMIEMESVKNRDGGFTQKPKTDFIGRHMCFGNIEKLQDKGKDPENCPTCAAANKDDYIGPASRRFAVHIIHYRTQPGSTKVQEPFSADLKVWTFADKVFDTLIAAKEEHGSLTGRDLLLTCVNKMYQNVDIMVGGRAEWTLDEARIAFGRALYANNKIDDLNVALGRQLSRDLALEDIQRVLDKSAEAAALNRPASTPAPAGVGTLDVPGLLDQTAQMPTTPAPESQIPEAPDLMAPAAPAVPDLMAPAAAPAQPVAPGYVAGTTLQAPAPEPAAPPVPDLTAPAPQAPAQSATPPAATPPHPAPAPTQPAASDEGEFDFDSLLQGL